MLASTCLMKTSPNAPPYTMMGEPCQAPVFMNPFALYSSLDIYDGLEIDMKVHSISFSKPLDIYVGLEIDMKVHSISFSRPHLQYAQLYT